MTRPVLSPATGRGFDLDVMKAVADDAAATLEPVWTASRSGFSEIEASDLPLGRLARGECDAAASVPGADSLGRLRDRLELSRPYYGAAFELVAVAGGPSSLEALAGRRVGVQLQSFAHLVVQSLRLDWRARPSASETLALLDSGEVDAALVWGPALATLDRTPATDVDAAARIALERARRGSSRIAMASAIDRALERLENGGVLERMAREHGVPQHAPSRPCRMRARGRAGANTRWRSNDGSMLEQEVE